MVDKFILLPVVIVVALGLLYLLNELDDIDHNGPDVW